MPHGNNTEENSRNRFENDLADIIHRTGGTFTADQRTLLDAGALRGRRKAVRRRATALTAGVITLAALGTAGVYATAGPEGGSTSVANTATPTQKFTDGPTRTPDSSKATNSQENPKLFLRAKADQMIKLLEISLPALPKGKFSAQRGTSSMGGPDAADASLVYDDGYGASLVSISARRVDPEDPAVQQQLTCKDTAHDSQCASTTGARGRKDEQRRVGGASSGVKVWTSTWLLREGFLVQAVEYNAPSATSTPTRNEPPLTAIQLRGLTEVVGGAFTGYGVLDAEVFTNPRPVPNSEEVSRTLSALVPTGYEQAGSGGGGDEGYVILRDKKTHTKTFLQVRLGHGTPTNGKVTTWDETGEQPGTTGHKAETVTTRGLRVTVTSYNAEYPSKPPTTTTPPLTTTQLTRIATNPIWQTLK